VRVTEALPERPAATESEGIGMVCQQSMLIRLNPPCKGGLRCYTGSELAARGTLGVCFRPPKSSCGGLGECREGTECLSNGDWSVRAEPCSCQALKRGGSDPFGKLVLDASIRCPSIERTAWTSRLLSLGALTCKDLPEKLRSTHECAL